MMDANVLAAPAAPPLPPLSRAAAARKAAAEAAEAKFKTELCRQFSETGHCRYGRQCRFAHGDAELRPIIVSTKYKTKMCKQFHQTGFCQYGDRCLFLHDDTDDPNPRIRMFTGDTIIPVEPRSNRSRSVPPGVTQSLAEAEASRMRRRTEGMLPFPPEMDLPPSPNLRIEGSKTAYVQQFDSTGKSLFNFDEETINRHLLEMAQNNDVCDGNSMWSSAQSRKSLFLWPTPPTGAFPPQPLAGSQDQLSTSVEMDMARICDQVIASLRLDGTETPTPIDTM